MRKKSLPEKARKIKLTPFSVLYGVSSSTSAHDTQILENFTLREGVIMKGIENKKPEFLLTTEQTSALRHAYNHLYQEP
tara:strand:- start:7 stop:243 length:237 start_codon:yes stop_codon:yes gene_type:complete